jgi:ABC-type phosphate transport system substrate-binding protein
MRAYVATLLLSMLAAAAWGDDSEVVVIANTAAPPMTKEQVAEVFLGKSESRTPLDQPNSAAIKAVFYRKVSGRDLSQVKATWARLIFIGRGTPPKELADATAVKKAVAEDPKAIGYVDKSEVDTSVKVVLDLK